MKNIDEKHFIMVCQQSLSMSIAASILGLHFNTFKRIAKKLKCYTPNQSGKGLRKNNHKIDRIDINDILSGKHPSYQTYKLKQKLLKCGVFKNICAICSICDWNGKPLCMELDHIDGDRTNHNLSNLRLLCPNCHAQTSTYRAKNIKK